MIKTKDNLIIKTASVIIAIMMILFLTNFITICAASFSGGSGTKGDPYLIKTPQDLDNIRNNLSAHYKLAATIDMSDFGDFEPVGTSEPFTGTLSCDLGEDGIPRYAILNLKVYNSIGKDYGYTFGSNNYAGYGEDGIHYYAALFGKTKGASISNIILLGVNIENTVVGQHGGAADAAGNPARVDVQCNDQATGGLISMADSTTIQGCGVQGTINSKTNNVGGLVGKLENGSSVLNCWTDCNFNLGGFWRNAGFIGAVYASSIQSCYCKGIINFKDYAIEYRLSQPPNGLSGFVRGLSSDSVISDCYSQVNINFSQPMSSRVLNDSVTFGPVSDDGGIYKNCYTTGTIGGKTDSIYGEENQKAVNCWTLNTSGAQQLGFKGGSIEEIKAAFSGQSNWDISGEIPTLKGIKYINDYTVFVAGEERAGAGALSADTSGNSSEASGGSVLSASEAGQSYSTDEAGESGEDIIIEANSSNESSIIIFWCLIGLSIALSAFSVATLFKALKIKKCINPVENEDEEEEYEEVI